MAASEKFFVFCFGEWVQYFTVFVPYTVTSTGNPVTNRNDPAVPARETPVAYGPI